MMEDSEDLISKFNYDIRLHRNGLVDKLQEQDPTISSIMVYCDDAPLDFEIAGKAIAASRFLKSLDIQELPCDSDDSNDDVRSFISGLSLNRSIESLDI